MDDFVKSGHGEWEDPELRTRCRILWRKPEQLASDIYDWAVANGYINSVCTVYELHSGEYYIWFTSVILSMYVCMYVCKIPTNMICLDHHLNRRGC